ncbi:MAG: type II toxin-antitoxin system VapC family toxin [Gemmatimonadaceae bacterium]
MPSVYVETSVLSYLAARPSRDPIVAGRQQVTRDWWATRRAAFELHISQVVLDEAQRGNAEEANRRLESAAGLPLLDATPAIADLARHLQALAAFPPRAATDALHVAFATAHGIEYLLTWNLRHIANAERRPRIERACRSAGFRPPVICTPDELMGGTSNAE